MIVQTNQFFGVSPEALYNTFLSSHEHGLMTLDGKVISTYHRPGIGDVPAGEPGDELRSFGFIDQSGELQYNLKATILYLEADRLIVMKWKNGAWNLATDPKMIAGADSTLVLTFKKTAFGAEIQMVHINVPDYEVYIPDTGEIGPLSSIVNTHWGFLYWEPMKKYFAGKK